MRSRAALGWVLVGVVAACGDNAAVGVDAAMAPPVDAGPPAPSAIVVATGAIGRIEIGTLSESAVHSEVDLQSDPVVRHPSGFLAVVNRSGEQSVSVVGDSDYRYGFEAFFSHSPQDIAVMPSGGAPTVYVPELLGSGVEVYDWTDRRIIDLSADDPDGQPNCMSALAVGSDVYVACALLDDTQATKPARGNAKIYVIDATTDTVRASVTLTTPYPTSLLEAIGDGTLAIATGDPTTGAGCVERITPGAVPVANGCIVRNDLIGGHATHLVFQPLTGAEFLWMAAAGMAPPNSQQLMAYDIVSGEMWPPISTPGETISDVGLCPDGSLVLADVTPGAAGLRVYQLATEVTTAPLSIGTPPSSPHGIACY